MTGGPLMSGNLVLVLFIVYGLYRFIGYLVSLQDARKRCEADLLVAERQRAVAEGRLAEIEESCKNYKNIDLETRIRLRTLVEQRIERLDLLVGPGDIEAAVVRMRNRSNARETKRIVKTGDKSHDSRQEAWPRLRGALKDVFAEYGGGEAYLRAERAFFRDADERK
jgi:hypothetical protein